MPSSKTITPRKLFVYATSAAVFVVASPVPRLFLLGAALALLGEGLRIWACGHLRKNQAVIQSGPYAHVKNPLYLGTFLILLGVITASTNPTGQNRLLFALVLPFLLGLFFFYYLPYKFLVEADRLRRRFGEEWDRYDQNVPDFIPRLTPYRGAPQPWEAQLVVENSEVSAALYLLAALAILAVRMKVDIPLPW